MDIPTDVDSKSPNDQGRYLSNSAEQSSEPGRGFKTVTLPFTFTSGCCITAFYATPWPPNAFWITQTLLGELMNSPHKGSVTLSLDVIFVVASMNKLSTNSWVDALQWRHNECDGISNHQPHDCLLHHLFRRRSKKTSKLRVNGLSVGNSLVTGEFPAQMASNTENLSIWLCHYGIFEMPYNKHQ